MKKLFLALLAVLTLTCAETAFAAASGSVHSAFLFADRKDWPNALGHARKSGNSSLARLILWEYLLDPDSGASFDDITGFMRRYPNWPSMNRLQVRAEMSLRASAVTDSDLNAWFRANPPMTGIGKMKYAESLLRGGARLSDERISYLLRDAWRNGDFSEDEEQRLLTLYGNILRGQDHLLRVDRLLWEEKTRSADRMLDILEPSVRALVKARIALIDDDRSAPSLVSNVPDTLQRDPGLIHSRLLWRARRDDDEGVRELLLSAPATVPYPERWWKIRELQVRKAIDEKRYSVARKLLANHAQVEGSEAADARWLSGWLSLQFLNDPQDAYLQFYKMYEDVKYPVSRSRAAYWAGRAADRLKDADTAKGWYASASAFPGTFYGQLAAAHRHGSAPLELPKEMPPDAQAKKDFAASDVARAARLALEADADGAATTLINHLIDTAENPGVALLAARMAGELHSAVLSVRSAKRALQKDIPLTLTGYPRPALPHGLDIESALALAIVRQESEFDPRARSRSGAMGMMQLLPSSAREIARKAGIRFALSRLHERDYNIRLGSAYLARLVNAYDGSYIQAIASYNAGPARVRQWTGEFGDPGNKVEDAVDWIEKIPYAETRNYVQRVMENLQVYRHLLATGKAPPLRIAQDLVR